MRKPKNITIKPGSLKDLRAQAINLSVQVRVGKNGVTDQIIAEISEQLKKRKLLKVKLLSSATDSSDKKTLANEIVEKTGAILVHKVGLILILAKKELVRK